MATASAKIADVYVELEFYHHPFEAATDTYPGCKESAQLERVMVGEVDIISMLDDEQIEDIERAILDRTLETTH